MALALGSRTVSNLKECKDCRKVKLFQDYTLSVFEREKNERRPYNLCQIKNNHLDQASNQTQYIGTVTVVLVLSF